MSTPVNAKTVRLDKGRHNHPAEGVCAMELASMLAGEPFTDAPRSVCPALAAFLRGYNDHLPAALRQDLLVCASDAVGSGHDDASLADERGDLLMDWAHKLHATRRVASWRRPRFCYPTMRFNCEAAGAWSAKVARRDRAAHDETMLLVGAIAGDRTSAESRPAWVDLPAPALVAA